ncbi:MAG TPA: hypothetical protein VFA76_04405 [Terriglobales bacterium]|nr:hypothetical protein [Terriglobales bacterium]
MKKVILACLGVALTLVLAAPAAVAQGALGTSSADVMINVQPNASLTWILPSATYYTASLATGGVGLRSQRNGAITISGVTTPMQAAYVYWAVITSTTTIPTPVKGLTVTRLWPIVTGVPASQAVVGTLVGKGASPCWSGAQILVYRAALSTSTVALGNGVYKVQLKPGASGRTDGADPWASTTTFPLFEGASLAFIGTGNGTVKVFDQSVNGYSALSGQTFQTSLDYWLYLSSTVTGKTIWHNIGADGQVGASVADSAASVETTTINSVLHAGPGATNADSDWNGMRGAPVQQLWDNTAHDVTSLATGLYYLIIDFEAANDCLTPVANLVEFR